MRKDPYTPGYSQPVVKFMARRSAETHAGFFLPELKPGWRLLDAGCGPGTITLGFAHKIAPGQVVGIDVEGSQFAAASNEAARDGLNVEFQMASVYDLPFQNQSFDVVFSHGLLEHLSSPVAAIAEFRRLLKPGGLIGLRTSDLGGLLVDSESGELGRVFAAYLAEQNKDTKAVAG
jgi:ubiquinone/menaquinone biosynthesis C-methylase UbiE